MSNKWWLEKGFIVEIHYIAGNEALCISDGNWGFKYIQKIIPRGVPFDIIPSWANYISFDKNGFFTFHEKNKDFYPKQNDFINFYKCPVGLIPTKEEIEKGIVFKTFEITNDLKDLIK